jgi:hypothetical protein
MAFLFDRAKQIASSRISCSAEVIRPFLCYEIHQGGTEKGNKSV